MTHVIGFIAAVTLIVLVLIDGFETILQPRRVTHRFRYARLYYRSTWKFWRVVGLWISAGKKREAFLGVFGPLSLLGLFATWILGLILGFALLQSSLRSPLHGVDQVAGLWTYVYLSGTTFVTLGYGDVTPTAPFGRTLAMLEAGLGFGFLAVVISYLPVLYQAFSRREVTISLLDARAGSPPSAGEMLLRLARGGRIGDVDFFLREWELWSAELLESHLSFPVLSYYRSQHDNQSWLAALATMLDTSAVLLVVMPKSSYQAQLTFAMARHAAVDLALVLKIRPQEAGRDRSPASQYEQLLQQLREAGLDLHDRPDLVKKLTELRGMYEPFLQALSDRFLLTLPPILPEQAVADNWQRSSWMPRTPGIGMLSAAEHPGDAEEHFK